MKNCLLILLIFIQLSAFGKTLEVASGGSIRQAIALAQPFDTILVKNGYYFENQLVITGLLSIIGENYPIIDAQYQNEIFTIKSNNVLIKGFT